MTATPPTLVPSIAPPVQIRGIALFPLREKWVRGGKVMFREARIPVSSDYEFQRAWKANKRAFYERGFCVRQENGAWFLQQWLAPVADGYALTAVGIERLAGLVNGKLNLPPDEPPPVILDLPALPEHLESKLFDYQIAPARQLYRALAFGRDEWGYSGALDASEMGTGKTYEGLAAALAIGKPVGVICRLSNIADWKQAFAHFGARPAFVKNYDSLRAGKQSEVFLEIYQDDKGRKRRHFVWRFSPDSITFIFDEIQSCRNTHTLQTGLLTSAIRTRNPIIGLSGTVAESPLHLWAVGKILGLHKGGQDWPRFLMEHGCEPASYGSKTWRFKAGRNSRFVLTKLRNTIFPKRGARVRKEDLGDRFQQKQIITKLVSSPETDAIAKAYKEADELLDRLELHGMPKAVADFKRRAAYIPVRHKSEMAKVPCIIELALEAAEEGYSVPIFVNFDDVRIEVMRQLKTECGIYGEQASKPGSRDKCIAAFQANHERFIVANIKAGGTGVNLHDLHGGHPRYSIICPNDSATEVLQVIDRTHRAGAKTPAMNVILCAEGTVEEKIYRNIKRKAANISLLNDGDLSPGGTL